MSTSSSIRFDEKDKLLIPIIAIGVTKLIFSIEGAKPRQRAKSHSHLEFNSLTETFVLFRLPLLLKKNRRFRQSDVYESLPPALKSISSSSLSKVLSRLVNMGILRPPEKEETPSKWGRPVTLKLSGPKSFYRASEFYNNLRSVLASPAKVEILYTLALKSGLILRYERYLIRTLIRILKQEKDSRKTWNIFESVNMAGLLKESDLERYYKKIRSINDFKLLDNFANKEAERKQFTRKGKAYSYLFLVGRTFFLA
jgi:hypothetical protein